MNKYISYLLLFSFAFAGLSASPTVIADDRIRNTGITPALGRGYSIASNTYQSICLENVVETKTSYNFFYKFEQLSSNNTTTSDTKMGASANGGGGLFGYSISIDASVDKDQKSKTNIQRNRILVTILVDTYYTSVDESQTRLSNSARTLLNRKDVPGFFNSCGMYYVRSISRFSKFVSLFEYTSKSEEDDQKFEAKLEASIKGWSFSGSASANKSSDLATEASERDLTITTAAWGLGKNENASLIAYDLDSFKSAVKDSFTDMQQQDIGIVTSIEVVPWIENTDFQDYLDINSLANLNTGSEQDDNSSDNSDNESTPASNQSSPANSQQSNATPNSQSKGDHPIAVSFKRKRTLSLNGEFLAEVDRVTLAKINNYYKAKLCREEVIANYTSSTNPEGAGNGNQQPTLEDQYKTQLLYNHRLNQPSQTTLSDLYSKSLSPQNISSYLQDYETFLYGSGKSSTGGGASQCVDDIMNQGITETPYYDIGSCKPVVAEIISVLSSDIDDLCMPLLVNPGK